IKGNKMSFRLVRNHTRYSERFPTSQQQALLSTGMTKGIKCHSGLSGIMFRFRKIPNKPTVGALKHGNDKEDKVSFRLVRNHVRYSERFPTSQQQALLSTGVTREIKCHSGLSGIVPLNSS